MFKKTVDSVIADISAKIGHLRDLAEIHNSTADLHYENALQSKLEAERHESLRDRATRIATKFEELLK